MNIVPYIYYNRRVGEDKGVGQYTLVSSRGTSVVDYVLSTQDLFTNLCQFKVHESNILSDHCLLTFSFAFQMHDVGEATDDNFDQVSGRYAWNHEFMTEFLDSLKSAATTERQNELNARIPNCTENVEINQCLTDFNAITERAASPFYKKHISCKIFRNKRAYINREPLGLTKDALKRNIILYAC